MAVTRSTVAERRVVAPVKRTGRGVELMWLLIAATIVCAMWALVYTAKVRRSTNPAPAVNLTEVDRPEKLLPVLVVLQSPADRQFTARRIFDALADHEGTLPNTGAIARIRIPRTELAGNTSLEDCASARARAWRAASGMAWRGDADDVVVARRRISMAWQRAWRDSRMAGDAASRHNSIGASSSSHRRRMAWRMAWRRRMAAHQHIAVTAWREQWRGVAWRGDGIVIGGASAARRRRVAGGGDGDGDVAARARGSAACARAAAW